MPFEHAGSLRIFAVGLVVLLTLTWLGGCSRKSVPEPSKPASTTPGARFSIARDEQTVTDTRTGLIWKRCVEGRRYLMKACLGDTRLIAGDSIAHFVAQEAAPEGWRLPTENEIATIVESIYPEPEMKLEYVVDTDVFPSPVHQSGMYYRVGGPKGEVGLGVTGWYTFEDRVLGHGFATEAPAHVRLVKKAR